MIYPYIKEDIKTNIMIIELNELYNWVYRLSDAETAKDNIQNYYDKINSKKLNEMEINFLSDITIFLIEKMSEVDGDFVQNILSKFINNNLDSTIYLDYYKLRILKPEIDNYKNYLEMILTQTNLIFPNNDIKNRFTSIIKNMANYVNSGELTTQVDNYINTINKGGE